MVTCPAGKQSISWLPNTSPKQGVDFEARFAQRDCTLCPSRPRCTRSKQEPRIIGLQTRELEQALQVMRTRPNTDEFRKSYAPRAGIESTHAQAIRRSGLRRTRYRGLSKTHCNMSLQPPRSTSCESHLERMEHPLPKRAAPTSLLSNSKPPEFATSVNNADTRGNLSQAFRSRGAVPAAELARSVDLKLSHSNRDRPFAYLLVFSTLWPCHNDLPNAHRSTMLQPELAGIYFFFSYNQQTGFRLPLMLALLGLALLRSP